MSHPSANYTVVLTGRGGFDVIQKTERPFPTVGKEDVLIKLQYAGVNFIDNYPRTGIYPTTFPSDMGEEGAGVVVSLPTDPEVISDINYIKRSLDVGGNAAVVHSLSNFPSDFFSDD